MSKIILKKRERLEPQHERTALQDIIPLKTPFMVFIDPSGACNFKCNFCPCNSSDYKEKWQERHKIMPFDLLKKCVDDLKQFDEKIRVIALQSLGEPMLNKELCRMIRYIKDSQICNEIRMFTNGSMLSPRTNEELVKSGLDYIRISVESLFEEDYRHICGYKMDLAKLAENVSDLFTRSRNSDMKIAVKMINLTLRDHETISKFYDIYSEISDYHYIETIENRWSQFEIAEYPKILVNAHGYTKKGEGHGICAKCFWTLCIHANGAVCPCSTDWKHANTIGNINDKELKEIWNSEQMREFRINQLKGEWEKIPFCRDCGYWSTENLQDYRMQILERMEKTNGNERNS